MQIKTTMSDHLTPVRVAMIKKSKKSQLYSQHFERLRWADHKVRSSRPAWPTWRNPISTKNQNLPGMVVHACNPSFLGGWGRRIAWTWEAEVAVSRDCAIALQPGQEEWNSIWKKKEKESPEMLCWTKTQRLWQPRFVVLVEAGCYFQSLLCP